MPPLPPAPGSEAERRWLQRRFEREMQQLGLDPSVVRPGHEAWPTVSSFLQPRSPGERALARVPGQARTVAGTVAEAVLSARARSAPELRNVDLSSAELAAAPPSLPAPLVVVVDGFLAQEVGCLLRTCETARVRELVLCGATPGPPDAAVLKTSLGAQKFVRTSRSEGAEAALAALRESGATLWALSCDAEHAVDLGKGEAVVPFDRPLALVLGGGPGGEPGAAVAAKCDLRVRLPWRGAVAALSGSIAGSVAIYDCMRQWQLM